MRINVQDYDRLDHFLVACLADTLQEMDKDLGSLTEWQKQVACFADTVDWQDRTESYLDLIQATPQGQSIIYKAYAPELNEWLESIRESRGLWTNSIIPLLSTDWEKDYKKGRCFNPNDMLILEWNNQQLVLRACALYVLGELAKQIGQETWENPYS